MKRVFCCLLLVGCLSSFAWADPCGMVPPIYPGNDVLITRVGEQRTYVFYKDGVETFAIRAGFSGKVDEFGMLIPFPTPPAIRKVPDNIFEQIQAAIDPPEVVVDLRPLPEMNLALASAGAVRDSSSKSLEFHEVKVIKQEAIGMYEVTTLEAGSAAALKRWMDDHGYRYPTGMDKVCEEFIGLGWCFVAVKTQVAQKKGVDPKPGQRHVDPKLPAGATFDGNVQAMGFRFKVKEFVVPMRLAAFNEGGTHNMVYLLTEGPRQVGEMSTELVRRQIPGATLHHNVTQPLPLRIIGGTEKDIPDYRKQTLPQERNPAPHNGLAKELFASDLLALSTGELALPHEEREKELLRIGERLSLRGPEIDKLNNDALATQREKTVATALDGLKSLTMSVMDGEFDRAVLAKDSLRFISYEMPADRNAAASYDARLKKAAPKQEGLLIGSAPPAPLVRPAGKAGADAASPGAASGSGAEETGAKQNGDQAKATLPAQWWIAGVAAFVAVTAVGMFLLRKR
jgi:hypothetical protein